MCYVLLYKVDNCLVITLQLDTSIINWKLAKTNNKNFANKLWRKSYCTFPIQINNKLYVIYKLRLSYFYILHLLNRPFTTGLLSNDGAGFVVKSSKFIIIKLMSSMSLFIGAITSEHRNLEPANYIYVTIYSLFR